ncbi:hypothetical protein IPA_07465 [Ignicoccus pacificus DSM 13166]|uniref:Uncharacterized protein n=1 Tax=Ignicoccus pacificus DSM 13166 TaxID=940294 RepID=A0A977KBS1_9CREN|nr:hypothetical protein IPA_07465 [Ignicoccus pacificus DSM 13166]
MKCGDLPPPPPSVEMWEELFRNVDDPKEFLREILKNEIAEARKSKKHDDESLVALYLLEKALELEEKDDPKELAKCAVMLISVVRSIGSDCFNKRILKKNNGRFRKFKPSL